MSVNVQNNAKLSDTVLWGIRLDRDASLHSQATGKLKVQEYSFPHRCKIPSRHFESNAQSEYHSNVENF